MLNSDLKTQLKTYLANITKQVTLSLALDDSAKSQELKQLADDIASLSTLIKIENSTDAAARKPSMTVISETGTKLAFAGIPLGHEFTSLVLSTIALRWSPDQSIGRRN